MTMFNAHPGEVVHCYLVDVATSSGAIADPSGLKFSYWPAGGTVTVATTSGSIITTGTSGNYYAEVIPTTSEIGIWDYRWSSTGDYKITQWGSFRVLDPPRST